MCSPNPYGKWQKTTAHQTLIFKVQKPIEALIYMSRSRSRIIHFCKKFWILSRDPVILMICCPLKIVHISCSSLLETPKFQSGLGAITDMQHTDTKIFTVYVQYSITLMVIFSTYTDFIRKFLFHECLVELEWITTKKYREEIWNLCRHTWENACWRTILKVR